MIAKAAPEPELLLAHEASEQAHAQAPPLAHEASEQDQAPAAAVAAALGRSVGSFAVLLANWFTSCFALAAKAVAATAAAAAAAPAVAVPAPPLAREVSEDFQAHGRSVCVFGWRVGLLVVLLGRLVCQLIA